MQEGLEGRDAFFRGASVNLEEKNEAAGKEEGKSNHLS